MTERSRAFDDVTDEPCSIDLDTYMDYLTHLDGPEEFNAECVGYRCVTPDGEIDLSLLCADPCLADPQMSAWRDAFVWRLIEKYGDDAQVVEIPKNGLPIPQTSR